MFDHRNDLKWSFCCVCDSPAFATLSPDRSPETIICFSCTGNHPKTPDIYTRAEYLDKCAAQFFDLGELSLSVHYRELAERERARPPLKPFTEPLLGDDRPLLRDLGIDI